MSLFTFYGIVSVADLKSRRCLSPPLLPSHNNWEGKCRGCVSMENENEKKISKKSSREIDQLKDGVKDLDSATDGVCCYFIIAPTVLIQDLKFCCI